MEKFCTNATYNSINKRIYNIAFPSPLERGPVAAKEEIIVRSHNNLSHGSAKTQLLTAGPTSSSSRSKNITQSKTLSRNRRVGGFIQPTIDLLCSINYKNLEETLSSCSVNISIDKVNDSHSNGLKLSSSETVTIFVSVILAIADNDCLHGSILTTQLPVQRVSLAVYPQSNYNDFCDVNLGYYPNYLINENCCEESVKNQKKTYELNLAHTDKFTLHLGKFVCRNGKLLADSVLICSTTAHLIQLYDVEVVSVFGEKWFTDAYVPLVILRRVLNDSLNETKSFSLVKLYNLDRDQFARFLRFQDHLNISWLTHSTFVDFSVTSIGLQQTLAKSKNVGVVQPYVSLINTKKEFSENTLYNVSSWMSHTSNYEKNKLNNAPKRFVPYTIMKLPVNRLKNKGESFFQDTACFEIAAKQSKCRECRSIVDINYGRSNVCCRFYGFRRLRYTKNGSLALAGFSDPYRHATNSDLKLWLPNAGSLPTDLDFKTSILILKQVGNNFCDLLLQEKQVYDNYYLSGNTIFWKRTVQGVREMCDVCETTIFNFHWACSKCGFVVCVDCFKVRKQWDTGNSTIILKERDEFSWLVCTNRTTHSVFSLMLTQMIAGDSLSRLGSMMHKIRSLCDIEHQCDCDDSQCYKFRNTSLIDSVAQNKPSENSLLHNENNEPRVVETVNNIPGYVATTQKICNVKNVKCSNIMSSLRDLLIDRNSNISVQAEADLSSEMGSTNKNINCSTPLDSIINFISRHPGTSIKNRISVLEKEKFKEVAKCESNNSRIGFRKSNIKKHILNPSRIMTTSISSILYNKASHNWLCNGKLLQLIDPSAHEANMKIFHEQWKRGQPVIISNVSNKLNSDLWTPESFSRDFGNYRNDLINCMTNNLVPNQPMKVFWDGFNFYSKRLRDEQGHPMLLKLKDWPPGEDFAEMLPDRFNDLMKCLPLPDYTHRTGRLNLASRLPSCFVRPDLGPKMYNAYGSALYPSKGTTNLHLDISDAVNVMVYVGIPVDGDKNQCIMETYRALDASGCDLLTRRRVREMGEVPGALWHIYNASDADKIRDLLNKVVIESGGHLEPHHDPIHDQSYYIDDALRQRLYTEYGVEGYTILQCLGDAVFIPAGAPHQVQNLHNCIKVAEDFVSPENISHCFHLTQEFRNLSDTHSNHEDKLQIKNIIYHAIKDAVAVIQSHFKYDINSI